MKKTTSTLPDTPASAPRSLREYFKGPPKRSQRDLAKRLDVHQSFISMLTRHERAARGGLAMRIAKITGVPLEELVKPPRRPHRRRPSR